MLTQITVSRKAQYAAAIFTIAYILIQCFQEYVFRSLPVPVDTAEELLQGGLRLHIIRSVLLLLAFFALLYLFLLVIVYDYRRHVLLLSFAAFCIFIFCFLEVSIRAIELFYIQLQLPNQYEQTNDQAARILILNDYTKFSAIQFALYFPLLFSQAIASTIISFVYSSKPAIHWLVKIAFGINALRLVLRMMGMFLQVEWANNLMNESYLVFTIAIYGPLAAWFLIPKGELHEHSN